MQDCIKRIINGRKYDTETAEYIGNYWSGTPGDFETYYEALYLKKTGEFFLYASGGPLSPYDGEDELLPLSIGEAKTWAERHLDGDTYEAVFGPVEE